MFFVVVYTIEEGVGRDAKDDGCENDFWLLFSLFWDVGEVRH